MIGNSIIITGGTGTGKSTYVKKLLSKVNPSRIILFDLNNEYPKNYSIDNFNYSSFNAIDNFCEVACTAKNSVIVFEEATVFFSNRGNNQKIISMLISKRHKKNILIFIFHSLRSIPRYIFDYSNKLILFKTNDSFEVVKSKFNHTDLEAAFKEVQRGRQFFNSTVKIY